MRLAERLRPLASFARRVPEPWGWLGVLVVVQWIALLALALAAKHNGWLYYQGGDQTYYWTTAWRFSELSLPLSPIGYGWSYLLTPLALIAGPNVLAGMPSVLVLQALLLLPLALVCVYGIAARIGGRLIGYAAAALFIVLPYAATPLFVDRYRENWTDVTMPQTHGMSALADFPSMVCLLVATYFLVRVIDARSWEDAVFAGLAVGFAIGVKPSNALFVPAAVLALMLARAWRDLGVAAAAGIPALATLALWKQRGLGTTPAFEDTSAAATSAAGLVPEVPLASLADGIRKYVDFDWGVLHDNLDALREFFWAVRPLQWVPFAGLIAIGLRSWPKAALVFGWFATFLVVKGTNAQVRVEDASFWRLMMPSFPAYLLLFAAVPLLVPTFGRRLADRFPVTTRPLMRRRRPVLIAAGAVFAAIPLLLIAAIPVDRSRELVRNLEQGTIIPVRSFGLEGSQAGGRHVLRWRAPYTGSTDVFYVVYRARPVAEDPLDPVYALNGIACRTRELSPGASECRIVMDRLSTTRATRASADAPPGRWIYRVGLAANWRNDPELGDVFLLSEPLALGP